jgi:hypothetical protein
MAYQSRLTGPCNRCGLCCQFEAADGSGLVRCGYLRVESLVGLSIVGVPGATTCAMYDARTDGMPIPMHYARDGSWYGWRSCAKDSPREDAAILLRGIGRGCSLEVRRDG